MDTKEMGKLVIKEEALAKTTRAHQVHKDINVV
jgi:hypothetical protein